MTRDTWRPPGKLVLQPEAGSSHGGVRGEEDPHSAAHADKLGGEARAAVAGGLVHQFLESVGLGKKYLDNQKNIYHPPVVVQHVGGEGAEHEAAAGRVPLHRGPASDVLQQEAVLGAGGAVLQVKLGDGEAEPGLGRAGVHHPLAGHGGGVVGGVGGARDHLALVGGHERRPGPADRSLGREHRGEAGRRGGAGVDGDNYQ